MTGARIVAGCVVLNKERDRVLLISSSAHPKKWVIPKGGVETDEPDYKSTAIRETWEEAGVKGRIVKDLGVIEDMRPPKNWGTMEETDGILKHPPRSEFHFYEMIIEEEFEVYPESDKRRRKWFKVDKAIEKLEENNRPELATGIRRSSLFEQSTH